VSTPPELTTLSPEAESLYALLAHRVPAPDLDSPALAELLAYGLVLPHPHGPTDRFIARDPLEVLTEKRERMYREIGAAMAEASALPERLRHLAVAYQRAEPQLVRGAVEYISGLDTINARLSELVASATQEILAAQPGGPRPADTLALALSRDLAALERGVAMRTLYRMSARQDAATAGHVQRVTVAGAHVRTLDESFLRAIIVDRRTAVVTDHTPPAPDADPIRALILHDPGVVHYAAQLFDRDWARASVWRGAQLPSDAILTEQQREVIQLLVAGTAQAGIARALNISPRVVNSQIAEIKRVSGANSLAQLGYWWGQQEAAAGT
jgi:DNA-binding CsgD family transcriptional regulator/sugar-specific transcriptional regulator TrmB